MTPIDKAFQKAMGAMVDLGAPTYRGEHWQWPSLDRGEWSPKSLLIIYHESGLHDEWECPAMKKHWDRLEKELGEIFGVPVFIESVNAAVSCCWPA